MSGYTHRVLNRFSSRRLFSKARGVKANQLSPGTCLECIPIPRLYKALSEAEKYNKDTTCSLTFADVCMIYFEIEISQTQGQNKSHCQHMHYLPEIDPMPI